MKRLLKLGASALLLLAGTSQAHDHIAVGVNASGQLQLFTSAGVAITQPNISTIYHLCPRPTGQRYGRFYTIEEQVRVLYPNDYFVFIAYSDGQTQYDGTNHAATGAYIWAEIASVTGPSGAHFGFWDENRSFFSTTGDISFTCNSPTGNYKFEVSEPLTQPTAPGGAITETYSNLHYIIPSSVTKLKVDSGEDPYGHIHNRGFTVDRAGDYYVGFRFHDLGGNGAGGGPLHASSQIYYVHFQAGPDFKPTHAISGNNVVLTWPSLMGIASAQTGVVFTVQRSTDLSTWQTLGTVTGTTGTTATYTDTNGATLGRAFYRLQFPWSIAAP